MTELKMRDLCEASGLNRQAIHFYIREGLVPPGRKVGRNQALYSEAHVTRLRTIRRLQHERFLPLSAIRAVLTEDEAGLSSAQREFLRGLREELPAPAEAPGGAELVDTAPLLAEGVLSAADLERAVALGFVAGERDKHGVLRVPAHQVPLLHTLGALRQAGLSAELGFVVDDLQPFVDAVRRLVAQEATLVAQRLGHLPPAQAGAIARGSLPLLQRLLGQLHETFIHDQLSAF